MASLLAAMVMGCGGGGAGDGGGGDDILEVDARAPEPDAPLPPTDAGVDAPPVVEELPPLGEGVGTLSGASTAGRVDGARGIARFANPVNVISDGAGGVLVADFDNGAIRRVAADGTTTTPVTPPATFVRPFGLARRGDTVWIQTDRSTAGQPTGALWKLSLTTSQLTLVRDNAGRLRGLAVLSDGRLVAANYQQHTIELLDPATGAATILAGAAGQHGLINAAGAAARFDTPYDLAVLPGDDVIVADHGNRVLRKVSLDGNVVTYAGDGNDGTDDGMRDTASFRGPQGLAVAADGTLYVSDPEAATIRKVAPDGMVSTIAGTGVAGYLDAADPRAAQLFGLEGIDLASDGAFLFVADGSRGEDLPYHRVRRLRLP